MSEAPERLWAHCFNTNQCGGWDKWGGYARPHNRHPLDDKERQTGAEYVRADLARTMTVSEAAKVLLDGSKPGNTMAVICAFIDANRSAPAYQLADGAIGAYLRALSEGTDDA